MSSLPTCGPYVLLASVYKGGMAEVFVAVPASDGTASTVVALKRPLAAYASDPDFALSLIDETQIASQLRHPNICRVYDRGNASDEEIYVAMEFVHGRDVSRILRRLREHGAAIPHWLSAYIVYKIALALDYAHSQVDEQGRPMRIVHRDVSPHNIIVSFEGVPKLVDFGIAKAAQRMVQTRAGMVKGKCYYMSPEQAMGGRLDGRSDIFALGIVLYELVTGVRPFEGKDSASTLEMITIAKYTPPRSVDRSVPKKLAAIIEKALNLDPVDRFAQAAEMAVALSQYLQSENEHIDDPRICQMLQQLFGREIAAERTHLSSLLEQYKQRASAQNTQQSTPPPFYASEDVDDLPGERTVITNMHEIMNSLGNRGTSNSK